MTMQKQIYAIEEVPAKALSDLEHLSDADLADIIADWDLTVAESEAEPVDLRVRYLARYVAHHLDGDRAA